MAFTQNAASFAAEFELYVWCTRCQLLYVIGKLFMRHVPKLPLNFVWNVKRVAPALSPVGYSMFTTFWKILPPLFSPLVSASSHTDMVPPPLHISSIDALLPHLRISSTPSNSCASAILPAALVDPSLVQSLLLDVESLESSC